MIGIAGIRIEQYGVISFFPGPQQGRQVVVLGGGSAEAEWAAAEYVTTPDHVKELVSKLRDASGRLPPKFQVVVRMTFRSGVPIAVSYVTHHVPK